MKSNYKIININSNDIIPQINKDNYLNKYLYDEKHVLIKVKQLIENTHDFCKEHFPTLINSIKREKRLLEFETPNRIKHSYEYTIINENISATDFYYLFTPIGRLDWLKIFVENERVSIADHSVVKQKLLSALKNDIKLIQEKEKKDSEEIIELIYNSLETLPCFIEINITNKFQEQISSLIQINFFSSLIKKSNATSFLTKNIKSLLSPIQEKRIIYNHSPIKSTISSWLYLRAPQNFEVNSHPKLNNPNIETTKVSDPSIASYVIKNGYSSEFVIDILVPSSLKIWFHTIYYLTLIYILFLFGYILDKTNWPSSIIKSFGFVNNKFLVIDTQLIINICLAIIASIIATRGWLIIEENVLKNISIKFSYFIIVLLIITFIISVI